MVADKALILSLVVFAGIFCQWLAWRVKLPAILFLLCGGIVAGPVFGWLDSDALFGDLLFPFISLSVAIILFEGSLTLKFHEIAGLRRVIRNMVSIGGLITLLITSITTHYALSFSWEISFLFGAITMVTGPTVIVPLLRTVRPSASVANILRWEGIVIDPIGATLAVLVYEFILLGSGSNALGHTFYAFGKMVAIGLVLGVVSAYLYSILLRLHWLPEFLHNVSTLAVVIMVFAISNALQHESGLLTVTVMGMWLANSKNLNIDEIIDFKESLSVLLISVLFIVLAARVDFEMFVRLGWPALFVFLSIQFLSRPLSVVISSFGSKLSWPERHLLAWIAPRGIVAAAISALFAIRLEQTGYVEAPLLVPLTFMVIIGTVGLQSATAGFIARWLGVAEPDPKGFLIVGANLLARAVGKALQQEGFRVLLVDTSWEKISMARMEGLPTYYGQPVSEHAGRHLDLVGIGRMLGLSPRGSLNSLSCLHYRMELGYNAVYALQTEKDKEISADRKAASSRKWPILFGKEVSFSSLMAALHQGWTIRSTKLTESFTFAEYLHSNHGSTIPLFALTPGGSLEIFTVEKQPNPQANWIVLGLVPPEEDSALPVKEAGRNPLCSKTS
ncbi:MAG: sodium:proton antiporter [Proteobacteria bacterium]|nr:sodium:proton antiporter [Pseudomonadota bacterium]MBU1640359.1 sodium:proton antiporter [Pseudomonadota bacterium]